MITRIVSRCSECGYDNRFPMDSDDSDGDARTEIESGICDGEYVSRMCQDIPGSDDVMDEVRSMMGDGWVLRDISRICVICRECTRFEPRIWYSMELRMDGRRRFRNNDILCQCGGVMERFDPVSEPSRKAFYTCVKCGTDIQLERRFKLKDYEY